MNIKDNSPKATRGSIATAAPVGTAAELPVFNAELTTAELDAVALPLQPPVLVVVVAATFVAL